MLYRVDPRTASPGKSTIFRWYSEFQKVNEGAGIEQGDSDGEEALGHSVGHPKTTMICYGSGSSRSSV